MSGLYPEIEPFHQGLLDVGNGHRIYWEECGNPSGKAIIVLHGGPGSGCSVGMRRYFDPDRCRIILFDQRGCGRSEPHASDPNPDLSSNTTEHLIGDIEHLRVHLDVDAGVLCCFSWGCTLGLAYAERYPDAVAAMLLAGVTMTRRSEIDWLYRGVAPLFPAQWERFRSGVPSSMRSGNLVEAYHDLLMDPDRAIHLKAAKDWCDWENTLISVDPDFKIDSRRLEPDFQLAFARIVTHYFKNGAWLTDNILLHGAGALTGIPGIMVQGRLDLSAPLLTAWELSKAWPDSELIVLNNAGHSSDDPGMSEAIVGAADRLATL